MCETNWAKKDCKGGLERDAMSPVGSEMDR